MNNRTNAGPPPRNNAGTEYGSSNHLPEPGRRHTTGGNMGAGRSGRKSFGSEKPEEQDNNGTKRPDDEL